jgi:Probable N6-adenine methyltransferase
LWLAAASFDLYYSQNFVCSQQQFFNPRQMCHYNMFNHYFFNGEKSRRVYMNFLRHPTSLPAMPAAVDTVKDNDILVVVDPPFGGLVDALAVTLKRISEDYYESNGGSCMI